jgi:hypothetical protein
LVLFFNFPLGTGSSTAAMTDSKCSLSEGIALLIETISMITEIGEEL